MEKAVYPTWKRMLAVAIAVGAGTGAVAGLVSAALDVPVTLPVILASAATGTVVAQIGAKRRAR